MTHVDPRIACAVCPLFPLAARLRAEPELACEALVIVEGNGHAARVLAATRAARRAGVRPGSTLVQARALVPKLVARARDPECEDTAKEVMLEIAESFSPRVEDGGPGVAHLDLHGLDRLHPRRRSRARAGQVAGPSTRLANDCRRASASRPTSWPRAWRPGSSPLPPSSRRGTKSASSRRCRSNVSSPELEIAQTLERWGLRSIGDFARLPRRRGGEPSRRGWVASCTPARAGSISIRWCRDRRLPTSAKG